MSPPSCTITPVVINPDGIRRRVTLGKAVAEAMKAEGFVACWGLKSIKERADPADVIADYKAGLMYREIRLRHGVCNATITKMVKDANIPKRIRPRSQR